ncbi:hypothetical protein ACWEPB_04510 [Kitasatospora cineracea]
MGGLLGELGKKLAERWLTLLVLPGAFYLAVAATGHALGQGAALDVEHLIRTVSDASRAPQVSTLGGQVVLLAAVLFGAAAVGLAAQSLGSGCQRIVLAPGWRGWRWPLAPLARLMVHRRQRRWDAARAAYEQALRLERAPVPSDRPDPARRHRAAQRVARISVERPERPTWSGDRVHAVALRLDQGLHVDLLTVWPHLWLVLPEGVRSELDRARASLDRATALGAWAVLYLPLAWWWWPAAPGAAALAAASVFRTRSAADVYATLLEATSRVHLPDLAEKLQVRTESSGTLMGRAVMHRLSGRFPEPRPAEGPEPRSAER